MSEHFSGDEMASAAALAEYGILDTGPEPAYDDIVRLAKRICGTSIALVSLIDGRRQWFKARLGLAPRETPIAQSVCALGVAARTSLTIPDMTRDPRTRDNPLVTGPPHLRFYAGALLQTPGGSPIGMLCVIDQAPRPEGLSPDQVEDLAALARQVMAQLELRRAVSRLGAGLADAQVSAASLAAAQEAGGTGAFDVDLANGRIRASEAFARIFGIAPADTYGVAAIERLTVPEDRHLLAIRLADYPHTGMADAEYRILRADTGAQRWIARRGAFVHDAAGLATRFVGTLHDVTERKLAALRQAALLALGDILRRATTSAEINAAAARILGETLLVSRAGYAVIDLAAGTFRVERDWTAPGVASLAGLGRLDDFALTAAELRQGVPVTFADIEATEWLAPERARYRRIGARAQIKVPMVVGHKLVGLIFLHDERPRTWSGDEIGFAQAVADRTYAAIAKFEAESRQALLNQELSHRLKNTLSMVQAIAYQTLKGAAETAALDTFTRRLAILGTAHDVLLQEQWVSAQIRAVIAGVLARHDTAGRIALAGPDLTIGPQAVLSLSMLLHELATNAVKYGALSAPAGVVQVAWAVAPALFTLRWEELGGPEPQPPTRRGFGSRLIEAGLVGTGGASIGYHRSGLLANFSAPLTRMASN